MERSTEESSEVDEYEDDILLTTSVANAINAVKMGFTSKVFGILAAQLLCFAVASLTAHLKASFRHALSQYFWMLWLLVPFLVAFSFLMSQFRTSSPVNLMFLALATLCTSCVLMLAGTTFSSSNAFYSFELFLVQQTAAFLGMFAFCFVRRAKFSFRRAFYIGAISSICCVIATNVLFSFVPPVTSVLAFLMTLVCDAYVLWSLHLQCFELCPAAFDIAVVGLYTQGYYSISKLFTQFSRTKSQPTRRNSLYDSL
eukprot:Plantae.Rhodophyta-Purpureofilum_apyrenoidigerum.ctg675.p1 GENE.Plantae.Rhodophyta-Purpureofilum_apyrenoidigerum.ctg675~~Plantae.Rhodophyta-Purpureofilum_apyrenoidigerum.ctg675.p1  ORF type:complete len:256 (+),score=12.67 Plantae.Rhodophyta-Purpureofilum_apyrenoidigerum.ctg675:196-963(+)